MWNRHPFFGGCSYYAVGRTHYVSGLYPPNEFEAACTTWDASNLPGQTFLTADEAMDASDEAFYRSKFEEKEEATSQATLERNSRHCRSKLVGS